MKRKRKNFGQKRENINIPEKDREETENQVATGREGTPISYYKHQGQISKEDAIFSNTGMWQS